MRNRYIVTYDVCEAKRLRSVFRTMRGYGDPLQYSVFVCELSPKERELMVADLEEVIDHDQDGIMIIDMGSIESERSGQVTFIGQKKSLPEREAVII